MHWIWWPKKLEFVLTIQNNKIWTYCTGSCKHLQQKVVLKGNQDYTVVQSTKARKIYWSSLTENHLMNSLST